VQSLPHAIVKPFKKRITKVSEQAHQLVVRKGPRPGQVFPLSEDTISIGRDPLSDIVINDPEVSRQHARLTLAGDSYSLQDMGSTNGTFVDGKRLSGDPVVLRPGQAIMFGSNVTVIFQATSASDPLATMIAPSAQPPVEEPAPVFEEPAAEEPVVITPVEPEEPVFEEPAFEMPEEPVIEEPAFEEPVVEEPDMWTPVEAEPPAVVEEPLADDGLATMMEAPAPPEEPEPVWSAPAAEEPAPLPSFEEPAAEPWYEEPKATPAFDSGEPLPDFEERPAYRAEPAGGPPPIAPSTGAEKGPKNNRNIIIAVVVLVLLCCCCLAVAAVVYSQDPFDLFSELPASGLTLLANLLLG
jgi:pSer/pThr/pTyr-binding forkhead associated (FHA) protein